MKLHGNAALSLNKRKLLAGRIVEEGWSLTSAAAAAEVSVPTARKWARRYLAEGEAGLLDRPSAAHCVHNRTAEERIGAICALRRLRMTGAEIAEALGMAETTVSGILTRSGLGRLGRIGLEPAQRYERSRPGELIHIDIKKLGRIGPNGAGHRVSGKRRSNRGRTDAAGALGIRHLRTRPYRPQTNGKAERFIRTMLGGWAYGAIYRSSAERTAALEGWLWRYNFRRPHGALGRKTPAARLAELNNPLGSYS